MNARLKFMATAGVLMAGAVMLVLGGCSKNTDSQWQRLVCEVSAINGGAPLISGYWDAGQDRRFPSEDDFLPIDHVPVRFHARPYNDLIVLPEDSPYSYFHITEYDLIWHPVTPGSEPLVNFNLTNAPTDLLVPVNEDAEVSILVADRYLKENQFIIDLLPAAYGGIDAPPFTASCELRFRGHETGSDKTVEITGAVMVSFVGIVTQGN